MTRTCLALAVTALTLLGGQLDATWGRGFGGMHGGFGGGGMRGGFGGGGMRGGFSGGNFGGMRAGGNLGRMAAGGNFGGMRPGGNFGGGNFGGALGGSGLSGLSSGRSLGNFGGAGSNLGGAGLGQSSRLGSFGQLGGGRFNTSQLGKMGFPGGSASGFSGKGLPSLGDGIGSRLGDGAGSRIGEAGNRPNRGQLSSFLGLPSDGGLHALNGNRIGPDQRGLSRFPNAGQFRHDDVRRDFRADYRRGDFRVRGFYTAGWYRRYPGAWYPAAWAWGNVWAATSWDYMYNWFGFVNAAPIYYDYGNNVTYQDNSVYLDGRNVGTSQQYYDQAETLANTGAAAEASRDGQWMPLGVFAMTYGQQTSNNLILQLAVNKQGIIRGNYTATLTNDTKLVQGSVDKKTQRAAWTIGDNKTTVLETGIYNLTKDKVPVLVHYGAERTEQWLLVRIPKPDDSAGKDAASGDAIPDEE